MDKINEDYKGLFSELEQYERNGIYMTMDGAPVSPMQVVTAHMIKEDGCYMRDYITDSGGHIKELSFQTLKRQNKR